MTNSQKSAPRQYLLPLTEYEATLAVSALMSFQQEQLRLAEVAKRSDREREVKARHNCAREAFRLANKLECLVSDLSHS